LIFPGITEVNGSSMHGDVVGLPREIAVFPDVYSERAERHFEDLAEITSDSAGRLRRKLFFVAHFPARAVSLNPRFPTLKRKLREALESGVEVEALSAEFKEGLLWINEGVNFLL